MHVLIDRPSPPIHAPTCRNVPELGRAPSGGPLVVIQETTKSLTATDGAHLVSRDTFNQLIVQPLMISFTMS
jgi:hypothetical protein